MKPEHIDALSAALDGELVEPALLAESLAQPDAAALLANFAALRVLAGADLDRPSDAFYATMATRLTRPGLGSRLLLSFRPRAMAACWIVAAFLAGYLLHSSRAFTPANQAPSIVTPAGAPASRSGIAPSRDGPGSPPTRSTASPPTGRSGARPPAVPSLYIRFGEWRETEPPSMRPAAGGEK